MYNFVCLVVIPLSQNIYKIYNFQIDFGTVVINIDEIQLRIRAGCLQNDVCYFFNPPRTLTANWILFKKPLLYQL